MQIECRNLSVGYDGNTLISNLNFSIGKGNYISIIGDNGAGKSTLMKTILGIKKPIDGEVLLGKDILRSDFGYLTQQKDVQKDFPASVKEIVISGFQNKCGIRPFYNKREKALAIEAMKKLGIENLMDKSFSQLSGGQRQRVLIARAICATEKILFLDEPVAGLDINITRDLYRIIEELNSTRDITIVMISHDIDSALKHATHVLYVGKEVYFETKEKFLERNYKSKFFKVDEEESR